MFDGCDGSAIERAGKGIKKRAPQWAPVFLQLRYVHKRG